MKQEIDKHITQEIYFELQKDKSKTNSLYNASLLLIANDLANGKTLGHVKRFIKSLRFKKTIKRDLLKIIDTHAQIITNKELTSKDIINKSSTNNLTFNEHIQQRANSIKANLLTASVVIADKLAEDTNMSETITGFKDRQKKSQDGFIKTQAKRAREYLYKFNDTLAGNRVRGWISLAILDNRTSPICLSLHNKFYSAKEYSSRFDLPYQIPRHPHCRSQIITVMHGTNITNYKGLKLQTFFKNNPKMAKDILGKKKYKIFKTGNAKIERFIDIRGRLFTNKELIKRLGIKSQTRLDKINSKE